MSGEKNDLLQRAKLAEQTERYEDMAQYMKEAAENASEFSMEDRNLISIAYKNIVGVRRNSWRIISNIEQKMEKSDERQQMVKKYREKVEDELRNICRDILDLLDKHLLPKAGSHDSKVFFLKMKGDYYRYMAEIETGDDRNEVVQKSQQSYQEAYDIARDHLQRSNPISLGLALNYSVFYYEILDSSEQACQMAKEAFDDAVSMLEKASDDDSATHDKDTTLILQLLKDNLALWMTNVNGDEEAETFEENIED